MCCLKNDEQKLKKFWNYFEKFWLSNDKRVRSWNVQGLNNEQKLIQNRTNNALECYNRYLKILFNGSHPSLLVFIIAIEKEARDVVQKVENIKYGKAVAPKRKDVHMPDIPNEHKNFKI